VLAAKRKDLNKSTKIWLNYVLGGAISALLLWGIYEQVIKQLEKVDMNTLWDTGPWYLLSTVVILMPINVALEAWKWQLLANSAQPTTYRQAFMSYIAGIAFSIVTPNRIGEYPGRLIYMQRKNTTRLVAVSVLGSVAQLLTLFVYGCMGLAYYNIAFSGSIALLLLIGCIMVTIITFIAYWRFDTWIPLIGKIKWLRRYNVYGKLLGRFTDKQQAKVLMISLLRYAIYTAQYLILLRWMNVMMPPLEGFFMSALFFWVIAVVPSVALVELGARGSLGIFLFGHFSANTIGILTATFGIWCINLAIPSVVGSLMIARAKLVR